MITLRVLAQELHVEVDAVVKTANQLRIPVSKIRDTFELSEGQARRIREAMRPRQDDAAKSEEAPATAEPAISPQVERRASSPQPETPRGRRVLLHEDMLVWTDGAAPQSIRRHLARALLQLQAFGETNRIKLVRGRNQGWRRTPLGGTGGNQFYLWWMPSAVSPAKESGFGARETLVRAVRHHDETDEQLSPGLPGDYDRIDPAELLGESASSWESPFTAQQQDAARSTRRARIIKGHPGTGKTIALLFAALQDHAAHVIYVTQSSTLAQRAREFLENLGSSAAHFEAYSFAQLVALLAGRAFDRLPAPWDRSGTGELLDGYPADRLRSWRIAPDALLDEVHAFLLGRALPTDAGNELRDGIPLSPDAYERLRASRLPKTARDAARVFRAIGADALGAAGTREEMIFNLVRDLAQGQAAADAVLDRLPFRPAAIVVDEVQDLRPLEYALLVELAGRAHRRDPDRGTELIVAGDEGQTVGNSAFDFGELSNIVAERFTKPSSYSLGSNLRSPSRIAAVVDSVCAMYGELQKRDRPRGSGAEDEFDAVQGEVLLCEGWHDRAATAELLRWMGSQPDIVVVAADPELARKAMEESGLGGGDDLLSSPLKVKGLEWPTCCVVAPSRVVMAVKDAAGPGCPEAEVDDLRRRRLVDGLRVALSRATDRLVLLEIDGRDAARALASRLTKGAEPAAYDAEELQEALETASAVEPDELVRRLVEDAIRFADVDLARARRRAAQAEQRLGQPDVPGAVRDAQIRLRAFEVRALLELRHYVQLPRDAKILAADPLENAARCLRSTGNEEAGDAVWRLMEASAAPDPGRRLKALDDITAALNIAPSAIRAVLRDQAQAYLMELLGDEPSGTTWTPGGEDIKRMTGVAKRLASEACRRRVEDALLRWSEIHLDAARWNDAAAALESHPAPPPLLMARCCAGLRQWRRALEIREQIGDLAGAMRCARELADFAESSRLARAAGDARTATLVEAMQSVAAATNGVHKRLFEMDLTQAEAKVMKEAAEKILSWGRVPSRA